MNAATRGPNLDVVGEQYDLLFGALTEFYPMDDSQIVVRQPAADENGWATVRQIPMHDRETYLKTILELGLKERINLSLAPRSAQALSARESAKEAKEGKHPGSLNGRLLGGAEECHGLVAIPFDIDVAGPRHAARAPGSLSLPTRKQADHILHAIPLAPGLVVDSGGGLHAYLLLEGPLEPGQQEDVLRRIRRWLIEASAKVGVACDTGPMTASGSLRVAGTALGKGGADHFNLSTIIRTYNHGKRWNYDDIVKEFELEPVLSKPQVTRSCSKRRTAKVIMGDDARPGTRFARALPISRLLDEVFGCDEPRPGKFTYPRHDGTVNTNGTHGEIIEHSGDADTEMVLIYGTRWMDDWGVEAVGKAAGVTSWDVLGKVVCSGEWVLAGRVAAVIMLDDDEVGGEIDSLIDLLTSTDRAHWLEAVTEAYGARVTAKTVTPTGEPVHTEHPLSSEIGSLAQVASDSAALTVPSEATEVVIGAELAAVVGGRGHGLWSLAPIYNAEGKMVLDASGNPVMQRKTRITDWLATRSAMTTEGVVGDELFDVTVLTASGRSTTVTEMTVADSLSALKVWEKAATRIPFVLPGSLADRSAIGNALAVLAADSRTDRIITRHTGLTSINGRHFMLGLVSSVNAGGVTHDHVASPPRGQTVVQISRPVLAALGWDSLPDDEVAAAGTVAALIGVAPTAPVVGVALLGVLAAAVTGCDERTTVILEGESGSGKSQSASCITPLYSMAPRSASAPPVDLEKDSAAFAFAQMRWHSGLPIWLDDARVNTESARASEASAGLITGLVQSAFNGSSGGRGSGDGGVRSQGDIECPGIMTAERLSTQTAVVNRAAVVTLGPDTIDLNTTKDRRSGLDAYTFSFADTGLANQMGASFYRWICQQLDERGEIAPEGSVRKGKHSSEAQAALAAWAKKRRHKHMVRLGVDRSTGNAAYLRMGWDLLYLWADAVGVRHLMPNEEIVDNALKSIIGRSKDAAAKADPGVRWIRAAADFVDGGRGHLVGHKGLEPENPLQFGWRQFGDKGISQGASTKMGYISEDKKFVVLMAQGLRDAAKAMDAGLNQYSAAEMDRFLRGHCVPEFMGKSADSKVSTRLGISSRPRGYVLPMAVLFGADEPPNKPDVPDVNEDEDGNYF